MCLKIGQLPGPHMVFFMLILMGKYGDEIFFIWWWIPSWNMVMKYGDSPWFTINFFGGITSRQTTILSTQKRSKRRLIVKLARLVTWHHFETTCDELDFQDMILLLICENWPIMIPQKARWFQGFFCLRTWWATMDWNRIGTIPCCFPPSVVPQKTVPFSVTWLTPAMKKRRPDQEVAPEFPRERDVKQWLWELCRPILRSYLSALDQPAEVVFMWCVVYTARCTNNKCAAISITIPNVASSFFHPKLKVSCWAYHGVHLSDSRFKTAPPVQPASPAEHLHQRNHEMIGIPSCRQKKGGKPPGIDLA